MLPTSLLTCDLTRELGYFTHKYMLIVFLFTGADCQVCITVDVGLGPKLHICILFTAYVHYMFMNATSYIIFISQYQLNQVFNFSISSTSLFQYRYSSIQPQLFSFQLIFAKLCSSPCTLHHSRYQQGSTRCRAQQQWFIVCVCGAAQDERCLGESDSSLDLFSIFS